MDQDFFAKELASLDELDDPLTIFEQRYLYLQSHQLPSDPAIIELLDLATRQFVEDKRYRNDPRYLRLWLAYARLVSDPNDVYAFLPTRGIAVELSAYYEEYANFLEGTEQLERAQSVLRKGVERGAQPLERLRRHLNEFMLKHPNVTDGIPNNNNNNNEGGATKRIKLPEKSAYDTRSIMEGTISFEEVRARGWRRAGSILKGAFVPLSTLHSSSMVNDGLDDFGDGDEAPDPDQLTHISIYKDNTADLRELARKLGSNVNNNSGIATHTNSSAAASTSTTSGSLSISSVNILPNLSNDLLEGCAADHRMGARLSLIPEESDAGTAVSGMISTLLKGGLVSGVNVAFPSPGARLSDTEFVQKYLKNNITVVNENFLPKIKLLKNNLQNGEGGGLTVSSLTTPVGNFFVTKQLAERIFLAMDLSADYNESELKNIILKVIIEIDTGLREAAILQKVAAIMGMPEIVAILRYSDMLLSSRTYYEHGDLTRFINGSGKLEEKLILFWSRQLAYTMAKLHTQGVAHGALRAEHVMLRIRTKPNTPQAWLPEHSGWEDLGVALVGFCQATCLELQGEEEFRRALIQDWQDYARLVGQMITVSSGKKYNNCWQALLNLGQSYQGTPHQIFAKAVPLLDELLVKEATILPPLKSLLIKLETERYLQGT